MNMQDLERDIVTRNNPDADAVKAARAALAATPGAELAAIPMYWPGKDHGIWTLDTEVRTVMGVIFLGVNSFDGDGPVPSYSWARDQAAKIAEHFLGSDHGVYGFATVSRDSDTLGVFEW